MRKLSEIRKDLAAKIAEVKAIDAKSPENAEVLQKGLGELQALQNELDAAEKVEAAEKRAAAQEFENARKGGKHQFSIAKFFREAGDRNLTGLEKEVAEMGAEEYRRLGVTQQGVVLPLFALDAGTRTAAGQNYGTAGDGGNLIETAPAIYLESLKERLVIAKMGAHILTDLVGNVPVIGTSNISAAWDAEADSGSISKISITKKALTMKRNVVAGAATKDLLRQTSKSVDLMIQEKLMDAHAALLEKAAIAGTGSNDQPTGILSASGIGSVAIGTNGGAITWAKIVDLETKIMTENAQRGKLGYLTNAKVWGAMKSIEKVSGSGRFVLEEQPGGILNGYRVDWTNAVPSNLTKGTSSNCSALIFGNFEDLYIGQWGGLDLVIDPFTAALTAEVRFVLNAWNDVLVAEPKSFAAIKDIVA